MIYRSRAPLRIGLAGGGTDVSPYSDLYGGAILNASVSLYAYANIEPLDEPKIILEAFDQKQVITYEAKKELPLDGQLDLLKGVYNKVVEDYGALPCKGFRLSTIVDAPPGSGLGTSSTLVVAILGAFAELLKLPLGEYDVAHYAYRIEREYLQLAGGKQDQYAATFGGVNYMEFFADKVIVNPLRIRQEYLDELEHNLVLYFTATSRESAKIIKEQQKNVTSNNTASIEAMHQLKEQAKMMKEALLRGNLQAIGEILDFGFQQKRRMAHNISNELIEGIYDKAKASGAVGGKISGAGGGGFMIFYCPGNTSYKVRETLGSLGGICSPYRFVKSGLTTWTAK